MNMSVKEKVKVTKFVEKEFPHGLVSPRALLERSRAPASPTHKYFEWDDTLAAEQHRLHQARQLIRAITIEVDGEEVRKYCSPIYIEEFKENRYIDIRKAIKDTDIWKEILGRALKDAQLWQKRYEKLKALEPVFSAISKVEAKFERRKK